MLTTVIAVTAAVTLAGGCLAASTSASRASASGTSGGWAATRLPAASAPVAGTESAAPQLPAAEISLGGARPAAVLEAELMVTAAHSLSLRQLNGLASLPGVHHTLALASGRVDVGRAEVRAVASDLTHLRAWMPAKTASSEPLWSMVAGGAVAASFDAGKNVPLPLGSSDVVRGLHRTPVRTRVGAYASSGLPGVDLIVNPQLGRQLGLAPATVLLINAPSADVDSLKTRASVLLGPSGTVQVLVRGLPVAASARAYLRPEQLRAVLTTALGQVGKPYVWGATGPKSFDCSGLVGYAYAAAGIGLPRVSEQMWLAGMHVRPQDALPGDLLFWAYDPQDPQDIDHVALYLGNGQMVSAPHTGAFVHVGPIPARNFRGIVRIIPAGTALSLYSLPSLLTKVHGPRG